MLFASEHLCKGHAIASRYVSKFFRRRLGRFALRNAASGGWQACGSDEHGLCFPIYKSLLNGTFSE